MRRNGNEQSAELWKDILSVLIYAVCLSIVGYAFMGRFGLLLGVLPLCVLVPPRSTHCGNGKVMRRKWRTSRNGLEQDASLWKKGEAMRVFLLAKVTDDPGYKARCGNAAGHWKQGNIRWSC